MDSRRKWTIPHLLCAYLSGLLLCSLAACAPSPASPSSPASSRASVRPTAAPTLPANTVLYQANWSHDLSDWQNTQGWQVAAGQLQTTSQDLATLTIPYRPIVPNYVLEVRLQIARLLTNNGGYFTFFATEQTGKDGYEAGVSDLKTSASSPFGSHPQAQASIVPASSMLQGSSLPIDYEPGFQWHIFRVKVQDNEVSLLVDGVQIGHASSNQTDTLSNGPVGLKSELLALKVSSIRILSL